MKDHKRRVMIIVWWWNYGGLEGDYDKWQVAGTEEGDCVIRIDQRFSSTAITIIAAKAAEYLNDSEVFIFLHRNHGYSSQSIEAILEETRKQNRVIESLRCFLFGEGSGSLYIASNPRGLLGTKGTFNAQRINGTTHLIDSREDKELKLLKKNHFDQVWNAYSRAFKAKVFELKEDMFSALSPFLLKSEPKADELYQHLRLEDNKLLFLRLLSFTGKLRKGSSQEKTLLEQENLLGRTLDFDDFSTNLETVYASKTQGIYKQLVQNITQKLLTGTHTVNLEELRDQFADLLQSMPEEVYN
ncbi:MAG: hypothetical protein KDC85_00730 [Saprospiraceae bacterium]|nr:hypothetical protein [Saprospiraceae bacterium]MCB9326927.1 hypothetical protein [Lewinellaceae bacterium]